MSESTSVKVEEIDGRKGISIKSLAPPKIDRTNKIRVLWYSDFLRHTGFGNVAEEIVKRLQKTGKYTFEVIGINHHGAPYNSPDSDYYELRDIPVWPAFSIQMPNDSLLGYNRVAERLARADFDLFFCLQDAFNLIPLESVINDAREAKNFRYVLYFPVDGDLKKDWVTKAVAVADHPFTYTEYGKHKVKKIKPSLNIGIVPHGVDLNIFKPLESESRKHELRKDFFSLTDSEYDKDMFLITNVNRNQPRKDIPRMLLAYAEFLKKYPEINSRLYLHCAVNDGAGHNLQDVAKSYLPKRHWNRVVFPNSEVFAEGSNGYPIELIREIYAFSDVVTSTSLGEGWGLSTTEAMACGTPVVMPRNTASTEIIGENEERGYLAKCGDTPSSFVMLKSDNQIMRPLTNIEDLAEKWKHVYDNKEEAKAKAAKAQEWLKDYTWDKIAERWDEILTKAYADLKEDSE